MKKRNVAILITLPFMFLLYLYFYSNWKFTPPVMGCSKYSYDQHCFGAPRSGHSHKGVDIFAKLGTPVISATKGIVIYTGTLSLGGKVVIVLGPAFKAHYYAHLKTIDIHIGQLLKNRSLIGSVGNTGNAKFTRSHLHYSIGTILPRWRKDNTNGLSFYTDPVPLLNNYFERSLLESNKN